MISMGVFLGACLFTCGFMAAISYALDSDLYSILYAYGFAYASIVPMMLWICYLIFDSGWGELLSMFAASVVVFMYFIRFSDKKSRMKAEG
ncbi:hypothetical protein D3C79_191580 [compost metagenome]